MNREEIDLRKLAQKEIVSENDLRNHAQNYSLLFFGTYDETTIFDSIKNRISEAKKNQLKHEQYLEEILEAKTKDLSDSLQKVGQAMYKSSSSGQQQTTNNSQETAGTEDKKSEDNKKSDKDEPVEGEVVN